MSYGPERVVPTESYNDYVTPAYLQGYINKLRHDLEKKFRLYEGKQAYIFKVNKSGTRCTECTDSITGEISLSNCGYCNGTGYVLGYEFNSTVWIKIEISAEQDVSNDFGNTNNVGSRRDFITLVSTNLLKDKDLIVMKDTGDIYKVLDFESQISAIAGSIITQTIQCSYLTRGSLEYQIIENYSGSGFSSGSASGG